MLKGAITAIITPFKGGKINYKKLEELIEFQISNGIDGIVVCGTTGESSTLSESEKKKLIKFTIDKVKRRIPVIAGTGSNDTKKALSLSKHACDCSADYLLLVSPYYNKCTQSGLINHYTYIADNVSKPSILYNVPSRTGLNILPKTVSTLSQHPNIYGLKEASGNLPQAIEVISTCHENFSVFSGNDDIIVPMLSIGCAGVISVLSNIFPKETHDICSYYFNGNLNYAKKLQLQLFPLINELFSEVNPIPVKEALNILGFDVGAPRMPLTTMTDNSRLQKLLNSFN